MPYVKIEGWDPGTGTNIGLNVSWTIDDYGGGFHYVWSTASSYGGFAPPIYLTNVNGKVQIFLATTYGYCYYPRLKISAYANGYGESASWFTGWQIVDSAKTGTDQTLVPYTNQFGGSLNINGTVSATSMFATGTVGANTVSATSTVMGKQLISTGMVRAGVYTPGSSPITNNGYFSATANCYLSQNAYVPYTLNGGTPVDKWLPWGTTSQYGSAVVVKTSGMSGTALNVAVDTTIAYYSDTLNFTDLFTITTAGKTGIGSTNPKELLQVNGNIATSGNNKGYRFNTYYNGGNKFLASGYGAALTFDSTGTLQFAHSSASCSADGAVTLNNVFAITKNGKVGINTSTPSEALTVNGVVLSQKVKVTQSGWADYVFKPDYELRPLVKVEEFIRQNGHLPETPTEKEVKDNGADIGDTQVLLLKKVEELTLYIIEQQKQIELMQKEIRELKKN